MYEGGVFQVEIVLPASVNCTVPPGTEIRPEALILRTSPYRCGNKIASRMRRNRRQPRIEGSAPDHLEEPMSTETLGM